MEFTEWFGNVSDNVKLKYLYELLLHRDDLQRDFKEQVFFNAIPDKIGGFNLVQFSHFVDAECERIADNFNNILFSEPDYNNYKRGGFYMKEWEIQEQNAESEIEIAFIEEKDVILNYILENRIDKATACLIALYNTCSTIEIDELGDIFGDSQTYTWLSYMKIAFEYAKDRISQIPGNNQIFDSSVLLFFNYYKEQTDNDKELAKYIEHVISFLISKSINKQKIYNAIKEKNIQIEQFPEIYNYFLLNFEPTEKWLEFAINNYQGRQDISENLLQYLFEHDTDKFTKIAFSLIDFNFTWNTYLLKYVNPDTHTELYKKIFLNIAQHNYDISSYTTIQPLLTEKEKEEFIATIHNETFKVKLYIVEKDFDKAKNVILNYSELYRYSEVISPLFEFEPVFCMEQIRKFLFFAIEKYRGSDHYARMAEILKIAQQIPNHSNQVFTLTKELYNYNYRLSALRAEFQNAKLI